MVELEYTRVLEARAERIAGSTPVNGTKFTVQQIYVVLNHSLVFGSSILFARSAYCLILLAVC